MIVVIIYFFSVLLLSISRAISYLFADFECRFFSAVFSFECPTEILMLPSVSMTTCISFFWMITWILLLCCCLLAVVCSIDFVCLSLSTFEALFLRGFDASTDNDDDVAIAAVPVLAAAAADIAAATAVLVDGNLVNAKDDDDGGGGGGGGGDGNIGDADV